MINAYLVVNKKEIHKKKLYNSSSQRITMSAFVVLLSHWISVSTFLVVVMVEGGGDDNSMLMQLWCGTQLGSSRGWGNPWGPDTPTRMDQGVGQDSVTRDIYFKPLIRQNS